MPILFDPKTPPFSHLHNLLLALLATTRDPSLARLHKLEGPSQEEIQAAKAATQKVPGTEGGGSGESQGDSRHWGFGDMGWNGPSIDGILIGYKSEKP